MRREISSGRPYHPGESMVIPFITPATVKPPDEKRDRGRKSILVSLLRSVFTEEDGVMDMSSGGKYISIEEFSKIDLRVGVVEEAERIPGTRLLRLRVNIGNEKRQIIAGLGEWYSPEELIGKRVIVVANLKPKRIRGYMSEGMLLAAGCEKGQVPRILTVDEKAEPGWRVC